MRAVVRPILKFAACAALAALAFGNVRQADASPFYVWVGTTAYEIEITGYSSPNQRYNTQTSGVSNKTRANDSGWFGNRGLAYSIASSFNFPTAVPGVPNSTAPADGEFAAFVYEDNGLNFSSIIVENNGGSAGSVVDLGSRGNARFDNSPQTEYFVFGSAVAVPEINGSVLAQALFVLGALSLAVRGLRRRSAVPA